VLVYAWDTADARRWSIARELVARLSDADAGAVSIQVLQEFYVTTTRKIARPLAPIEARRAIEALADWTVISPSTADILAAIDESVRWQVTFWDAMILRAARRAGCEVVWSEDLAHGQTYDRVTVRNPFR
jgi:predicted nucleic acid-binding protein